MRIPPNTFMWFQALELGWVSGSIQLTCPSPECVPPPAGPCLSINSSSVLVTQTWSLAPSWLSTHPAHLLPRLCLQNVLRIPPFLSSFSCCHRQFSPGFLPMAFWIWPLLHSKSCSVVPISFGLNPMPCRALNCLSSPCAPLIPSTLPTAHLSASHTSVLIFFMVCFPHKDCHPHDSRDFCLWFLLYL